MKYDRVRVASLDAEVRFEEANEPALRRWLETVADPPPSRDASDHACPNCGCFGKLVRP